MTANCSRNSPGSFSIRPNPFERMPPAAVGLLSIALLVLLATDVHAQTFKPRNSRDWATRYPAPFAGRGMPYDYGGGRQYFFQMGPTGASILMHEKVPQSSGLEAAFPRLMVDDRGKLAYNCYEVLRTIPGSPAHEKLQRGDIILKINGKDLLSADEYGPIDPAWKKRTKRGLAIQLGDLIDESEGRPDGKMTLDVLRVPQDQTTVVFGDGKRVKARESVGIDVDISGADLLTFESGEKPWYVQTDGFFWVDPVLVGAKGSINLTSLPPERREPAIPKFKSKFHEFGKYYGKNRKGDPIRIDGQAHENAIWSRGGSAFSFRVPEGYTGLRATVVCRDEKPQSVRISATTFGLKASGFKNGEPFPESLKQFLCTVELRLKPIGAFSRTFPKNCPKSEAISDFHADWLVANQQADGSWYRWRGYTSPSFDTSICALALMSTGKETYAESIRKAAYFVGYRDNYDSWTVPVGQRLIFLSEYYLRTKDVGILKAIERAYVRARDGLHFDFASGHKVGLLGYDGWGYCLGMPMIATGLAIADKTPVNVDPRVLKGVYGYMARVAPNGVIPYGKVDWLARQTDNYERFGHNARSGAGLVGANLYRGSSEQFIRAATRLFVATLGAGDECHASNSLGILWSTLATAMVGDSTLRKHMDFFKWKINTQRGWEGGFVQNPCNMQYQGAEGGAMGLWWRTSAYIIMLNVHRHNLTITGHPAYRTGNGTPGLFPAQASYKCWEHRVRDCAVADAILKDRSPASLKALFDTLKSMDNTMIDDCKFAEAHLLKAAPQVCQDIHALSDVPAMTRAYAIELVLGLDFMLYGGNGGQLELRLSWPFPGVGRFATPERQMELIQNNPMPLKGSLCVLDSKGLLGAPLALDFDSRNEDPDAPGVPGTKKTWFPIEAMPYKFRFAPRQSEPFTLPLQLRYTVGSIPIEYTRDITFNLKSGGEAKKIFQPQNVKYSLRRAVPVDGTLLRDQTGDELFIQLANGHTFGLMAPETSATTHIEYGGEVTRAVRPEAGDLVRVDYISYSCLHAAWVTLQIQKKAAERRPIASITLGAGEGLDVTTELTDGRKGNYLGSSVSVDPGSPLVICASLRKAESVNTVRLLCTATPKGKLYGGITLDLLVDGEWQRVDAAQTYGATLWKFPDMKVSKLRLTYSGDAIESLDELYVTHNPRRPY
jgi:hypothetical protein